ncbi:hypothetical protein [Hymenobacter lapidarius]|uniref:hypothetical protein n=1 Tax=Hymenobacter lapidarius TaxID=1908237 RepID=UPI000F792C64|nr:hypothetical protein [Hymenobacter lapidarius]
MARNKYQELAPVRKRKRNIRLLKSAGGCLILILLLAGIPVAVITYSAIRSHYLRTEGVITEAVVIDDKNYLANNNVARKFTYSYQFVVNSEKYTGNSLDSRYRVGDIVKIKYAPTYPRFNEMVK